MKQSMNSNISIKPSKVTISGCNIPDINDKNLLKVTGDKKTKVISILSKGGFGILYNVIVDKNLHAVLKLLLAKNPKDPKDPRDPDALRIKKCTSEAAMSTNLRSQYIVKTFMIFQKKLAEETWTGIYMERCIHKDLRTIIRNINEENLYKSVLYKKRFNKKQYPINWMEIPSDSMLRHFFIGSAYGLEYLNRSNLVHCDIKPDNILIADNMRVRLTDFGLAQNYNCKEEKFKLEPSTKGYMGPEYFVSEKKREGKENNKEKEVAMKDAFKVDYYPLGCCFYYFIFKESLKYGKPQREIEQEIQYIKIDPGLKVLLKQLLNSIDKRPNIFQILNNHWVSKNLNQIRDVRNVNYDGVSKLLLEMQKLDYLKYKKVNTFESTGKKKKHKIIFRNIELKN